MGTMSVEKEMGRKEMKSKRHTYGAWRVSAHDQCCAHLGNDGSEVSIPHAWFAWKEIAVDVGVATWENENGVDVMRGGHHKKQRARTAYKPQWP
jgi:hypothetical protein